MPVHEAWGEVGAPVLLAEQAKFEGVQLSPLISPADRAARAHLAELHGNVPAVRIEALPARVSLAEWQTPIRNQMDRGTCYTFAGIAALEAAIKRQYGQDLDLSEQYLFHVHCCSDPLGGGVNPPIIETGTSLRGGGGGGQDILEALCRIAVPLETECAYLTETQLVDIRAMIPAAGKSEPTVDSFSSQEAIDALEFSDQVVPLDARARARYHVAEWASLPNNPTRGQLQAVLASGHELVVDIEIAGAGGHSLLLIGYDDGTQTWLFKNSWGGDQYTVVGYGEASFTPLSACYITAIAPADQPPQIHARWIGHWFVDIDGWRGDLVIRRFTDRRQHLGENHVPIDNQPTKLGDLYRDGVRYDAMGHFEDDGRTMVMWVADDAVRHPVPTESGTRYDAHIFSEDPTLAAGFASRDGETWGFSLSRRPFEAESVLPATADSWDGVWEINHDGYAGMLTVEGQAGPSMTLQYLGQDGASHAVVGSVDPSTPTRLLAQIRFGDNSQPLDLRLHGWEARRFSGTTQLAGQTFGVQGRLVT